MGLSQEPSKQDRLFFPMSFWASGLRKIQVPFVEQTEASNTPVRRMDEVAAI
jgi:hypothetical protein